MNCFIYSMNTLVKGYFCHEDVIDGMWYLKICTLSVARKLFIAFIGKGMPF